MVTFYKKQKKYNKIQLTKNKIDLNIRKMTNHPPTPVDLYKNSYVKNMREILHLEIIQSFWRIK